MNGINCAGFEKLVNEYLDNELDMESRARVEAHAKNCPECGRLLDEATSILTRCAELDEGLVMPLEAQVAWRKAVREEASLRRGRKALSWVRPAGAVAAALVVLVGGTFMLRSNKSPLSLIQANTGVVTEYSMAPDEEIDGVEGYAQPQEASMIAGGTERMFFDADGAVDDTLADPDVAMLDPIDEVPTGSDSSVTKDDIKLLRSASRDIETSEFDGDMLVLKDLVEEYNGLIESENTYGQKITAENPNGRFAYLNLRIPSEHLDDFLSAMDAVGTIRSRSENAEDISMQYYDAKTRLDNQKAFRASLQAMVSSAQGVTELIEIQRSLADVQTEIDTLEGQLRGWDSRVSLSSVNVSMQEVAPKDAVNPIDKASLGERLRTSFYASVNAFSAFLQDMMVFVVLVWPWLLIAVVLCIVIGAVVRRRRRAK